MKIHLSENGPVLDVEPDVLDYLTLHYGNQLLKTTDELDSTLQFGLKLVTKAVSKKLLESFGKKTKLPRGTDPTVYLVKAYIVLMRESLAHMHIHLEMDGLTVVEGRVTYEGMDGFVERMGEYLEGLKSYVGSDSAGEPGEIEPPDTGSAGPELAASGPETFGQDDRRENHRSLALPNIS